jgi:hypothetical protein
LRCCCSSCAPLSALLPLSIRPRNCMLSWLMPLRVCWPGAVRCAVPCLCVRRSGRGQAPLLSAAGEEQLKRKFEALCGNRSSFDTLLAQMGGR